MPTAGDDTKKATVRRELENIRRAHRALNAEIVVQEAHDPKHPLHPFFEWDNRKAGSERRA